MDRDPDLKIKYRLNRFEREVVKDPDQEISLKAWKKWMSPRRIFYIVILVLLFVTLVIMIVSAGLTSSAQINRNDGIPPPAFSETAAFIVAPSHCTQGSIMFSSDYTYIMNFTDDLYLQDVLHQKVLWNAQSNLAGSLTILPTSTNTNITNLEGTPLFGQLLFSQDGNLTIVDGFGNSRWTNNIHIPSPNASNPWVLLVTSQGNLQIQNLKDANIRNYSNFIWRINETTKPTIPYVTSLQGPFVYAPQTFILQSSQSQYFSSFLSNGQLQIVNAKDNIVIWQSSINPAIQSVNPPFTLHLTCSGDLLILNNLGECVWSSQTGSFESTSLLSHYEITLNDLNGNLQLFSSSISSINPIWTNQTLYTYMNPPLSVTSPLSCTPRFSLINQNQNETLTLKFNSIDQNDPNLFTDGDLLLISSNYPTNFISLSDTKGRGKTVCIDSNGNFSIQDQQGRTIYQILNIQTNNENIILPISFTLLTTTNQFTGQYYTCQNALNIPLWYRPILDNSILSQIPSILTGQDNNPLPIRIASKQLPDIFYLLRSNNNIYVLQMDLLLGTLSIQNINTGNLNQNQLFSFFLAPIILPYFTNYGLFLLRNTFADLTNVEGYGQSSWNSQSAQYDFPSTDIRTSLIDEKGTWMIQRQNNIIIWSGTENLPNYSITSPFTIHLPNSLHLQSPNGQYSLIFDAKETSGNLIFKNNVNQLILWESGTNQNGDSPNNFLIMNNAADLLIYASSNLNTPIFVIPSQLSIASLLPGTLEVSNDGSFGLRSMQNVLIWYINGVVPNIPSQIQSPFESNSSTGIYILKTNPSQFGLFYKQGILSIQSLDQNDVVSGTIWSTPTPSSQTRSPYFLQFQQNGTLIIFDSSQPPQTIWNTNTSNFYDPDPPYILQLVAIGFNADLRILCNYTYNIPNKLLWSLQNQYSIATSTSSPALLQSNQWILYSPNLNYYVNLSSDINCTNPILSNFIFSSRLALFKFKTKDRALSNSLLLNPHSFNDTQLSLLDVVDTNQNSLCTLQQVPNQILNNPIVFSLTNHISTGSSFPSLFLNTTSNTVQSNLLAVLGESLYQVPTSICIDPTQGWYAHAGFQMSSDSKSSFLNLTTISKQLLLRGGQPLEPSSTIFWNTPDASSVPLASQINFSVFLIPNLNTLGIGIFNSTNRTINTLWSNGQFNLTFTNQMRLVLKIQETTTTKTVQKSKFLSSREEKRIRYVQDKDIISAAKLVLQLYTNPSCSGTNSVLFWQSESNFASQGLLSTSFQNSINNNVNILRYPIGTSENLLSIPTGIYLKGVPIPQKNNTYYPNLRFYSPSSNPNNATWSLSTSIVFFDDVTASFMSSNLTNVFVNEKNQFQIWVQDEKNATYLIYSTDPNDTNGFPGALTVTTDQLVLFVNSTIVWQRPISIPLNVFNFTLSNFNLLNPMQGQTIFYTSTLSFLENGTILLQSSTGTTLWENASSFISSPYYYFNINQLSPLTKNFPIPAFHIFLSYSGNLVIRDQSDYVLWCSGTATYDESEIYSISPQLVFQGLAIFLVKNQNAILQNAYWSQGLNISPKKFWSLSSPAVLRSSTLWPVFCNLSRLFLPSNWYFKVPALNLASNGNLQVITQSSFWWMTSTNQLVQSTISFPTIWSSTEDGFYPSETFESQQIQIGKTSSQPCFFSLNSQGVVQIFDGTFPVAPTASQVPLFFIGNSQPVGTHVEISVRLAGVLISSRPPETEPFWGSAQGGYVTCGIESVQSSPQIQWQLPPLIPLSTISTTNQYIFCMKSTSCANYTLWAQAYIPNTTTPRIPLLISANGQYVFLFQTVGNQTNIGVVTSTVHNSTLNTAIDLNQFNWYCSLVIGNYLYTTKSGNCFISDLKVGTQTYPKITFQTYTAQENYADTVDSRFPFRFILKNSGRLQLLDNLQNVLWSSPTQQQKWDPNLLSISNFPRMSYTFGVRTLDNDTYYQNSTQIAFQKSGISWSSSYCPGLFLFSSNGNYCMYYLPTAAMTMISPNNGGLPSTSLIWLSSSETTDLKVPLYFEMLPSNPNFFIALFDDQKRLLWLAEPGPSYQPQIFLPPYTLLITNQGELSFRDINYQYIPIYPDNTYFSWVCVCKSHTKSPIVPFTAGNTNWAGYQPCPPNGNC